MVGKKRLSPFLSSKITTPRHRFLGISPFCMNCLNDYASHWYRVCPPASFKRSVVMPFLPGDLPSFLFHYANTTSSSLGYH